MGCTFLSAAAGHRGTSERTRDFLEEPLADLEADNHDEEMIEYILKASTALFMGFFPFFEILFAVPAAIAMGLDYVSAVVWSSVGNILPAVMIVAGYERLSRWPRVEAWIEARKSARFERLINEHGAWFVLIITPWIGVWAVAVTAVALGMERRQLIIYSGISITVYAVAIAALIALGVEAFT
jgi:uncharacterized membrane protein